MAKRKRRVFTDEFKADTVRLCQAGGRSIGQVAKDLDLGEVSLRAWLKLAREDEVDRSPAAALNTAERIELGELRKRVKRLEMEREILKKAAVSSTGDRNTCVKSIRWSSEVQGLPWPFVELTSHLVQVGLGVRR